VVLSFRLALWEAPRRRRAAETRSRVRSTAGGGRRPLTESSSPANWRSRRKRHLVCLARIGSFPSLDSFSPALRGLRDGLPRRSPVPEGVPADLENSSQRREEFREPREESSERLEKSSRRLKDSSQRRFQPKSARSCLRTPPERLFQRRQEGRAPVSGRRAPRSRLKQPLSRDRRHGFGPKEKRKRLLERRCGAKSVVSKRRKGRDRFLEPL
jgi:hypothetical protein